MYYIYLIFIYYIYTIQVYYFGFFHSKNSLMSTFLLSYFPTFSLILLQGTEKSRKFAGKELHQYERREIFTRNQ